MLHGAILRSPYAHARIVSIDTSAAEAHPKVQAVITGAMLETLGLAWMPTLSHDTQAVLATDKVRFQGQEVAFVVAEDRYIARDALELIDVDYEPLPPVDRRQQGARPGRPGHPRRQRGQDRQPHLRLGGRRQGGDRRRRSPRPRSSSTAGHALPARAPGADGDLRRRSPTWTRSPASSRSGRTTQAPHAHRTRLRAGRRPARAQDPGDQRPTSAAASATRSASTRATCCSIVGSIVTGKPVKWMEDRSREPDVDRRSPATTTCTARSRRRSDGKILGAARSTCSPTTARSTAPRSRRSSRPASSTSSPARYDYPAAHCKVTRRLHEQGARRRRLRLLVPHHRGGRTSSSGWSTASPTSSSMDPAELRLKNLLRPEQFPYTTPTGWEYDSGDYPRTLRWRWTSPATTSCAASRPRSAPAASCMGIGISFFTEGVGAGPRKHMDILGLGMADGCELRVHPTGKAQCAAVGADPGPGPRDDVRPDRRAGARHPARGHRGHPRRHRQHAVRPRHLRLALDAGVRRGGRRRRPHGSATRRGSSRRRRSSARPTTSSGSTAAGTSRATRSRARRSRRSRWPRTARSSCPRASRATSTRQVVYNPPNLTYPFGAYICVVDVDPGTGQVKVRRFIAVDDCGAAHQPDDRRGPGPRRPRRRHRHGADGGHRVRRGRQLPRRLVHGLPAADVDGVPELGARRDGHAVAAPPDRRQGRRRVGHGRLARRRRQRRHRRHLKPFGVRHADMPLTPAQVWRAMQGRPFRTDLAVE